MHSGELSEAYHFLKSHSPLYPRVDASAPTSSPNGLYWLVKVQYLYVVVCCRGGHTSDAAVALDSLEDVLKATAAASPDASPPPFAFLRGAVAYWRGLVRLSTVGRDASELFMGAYTAVPTDLVSLRTYYASVEPSHTLTAVDAGAALAPEALAGTIAAALSDAAVPMVQHIAQCPDDVVDADAHTLGAYYGHPPSPPHAVHSDGDDAPRTSGPLAGATPRGAADAGHTLSSPDGPLGIGGALSVTSIPAHHCSPTPACRAPVGPRAGWAGGGLTPGATPGPVGARGGAHASVSVPPAGGASAFGAAPTPSAAARPPPPAPSAPHRPHQPPPHPRMGGPGGPAATPLPPHPQTPTAALRLGSVSTAPPPAPGGALLGLPSVGADADGATPANAADGRGGDDANDAHDANASWHGAAGAAGAASVASDGAHGGPWATGAASVASDGAHSAHTGAHIHAVVPPNAPRRGAAMSVDAASDSAHAAHPSIPMALRRNDAPGGAEPHTQLRQAPAHTTSVPPHRSRARVAAARGTAFGTPPPLSFGATPDLRSATYALHARPSLPCESPLRLSPGSAASARHRHPALRVSLGSAASMDPPTGRQYGPMAPVGGLYSYGAPPDGASGGHHLDTTYYPGALGFGPPAAAAAALGGPRAAHPHAARVPPMPMSFLAVTSGAVGPLGAYSELASLLASYAACLYASATVDVAALRTAIASLPRWARGMWGVRGMYARCLYERHDVAASVGEYAKLFADKPYGIGEDFVRGTTAAVVCALGPALGDVGAQLGAGPLGVDVLLSAAAQYAASDTTSPAAMAVTANVLSSKESHDASVAHLVKACDLSKTNVEHVVLCGLLHALLGHEHLLCGNHAAAAESFGAAIRRAPRQYSAWFGLGQASVATAGLQLAAPHYIAAVRLNPSNPHLLHSVADVLAGSPAHARTARALIRSAIAVAPSSVGIRVARAGLLASAGRHADALRELEALPYSADAACEGALRVMAGCYAELGRTEEAVDAYTMLLDLVSNADAHVRLFVHQ